ncbi:hypothetical protein DFJ77DRAFT_164842 [Powellomyces hirtus]|nr:hypothetical protein DFJ77DRAFT_164842 [Powellomyces hirtus]
MATTTTSNTMPRSRSLVIESQNKKYAAIQSAVLVSTSPLSATDPGLATSSSSSSLASSAGPSAGPSPLPLSFANPPVPSPPQHNLLRSALDLDTRPDTRLVDDPAHSRVHSCAHMFLSDSSSTNNACPAVSSSSSSPSPSPSPVCVPHVDDRVAAVGAAASVLSSTAPMPMAKATAPQHSHLHHHHHHHHHHHAPQQTTTLALKRFSWGTPPPASSLFPASLPTEPCGMQLNAEPPQPPALIHQVSCPDEVLKQSNINMDIDEIPMLAPAVESDQTHSPDMMDVHEALPREPLPHNQLQQRDRTRSSRTTCLVASFPPELLVQIFSHFDPPSRDSSTAFLSPASTIAALRHCASVCRWWNRVATRVLWRRPRVYDAARFEKLVSIAELACQSPQSHNTAMTTTTTDPTTRTTFAYPELIQHLSLSQTLSEPHRYAHRLSPLLVRLVSLPTLHLATLDLGFCKGVSNFALQRCAHALRSLTSLNLAGGGRSEICVIKLASECRGLRRLGLGWNSAVTDFCVREVGRWCPLLEWIDLSGCYGVGDTGILWLVKGLVGSDPVHSAKGASGHKGSMPPLRLRPVAMVPSNAPSPGSPSSATTPASPWSPGFSPHYRVPSSPIAAAPPARARTPTGTKSSSTPLATAIPSPAGAASSSSLSSSSTSTQGHSHSQSLPSSFALAPAPIRPRRSVLKHINLSYCTHITTIAVRDLLLKCGDSLDVVNIVGCGDMSAVRTECAWTAMHLKKTSGGATRMNMDASPPPPLFPQPTPPMVVDPQHPHLHPSSISAAQAPAPLPLHQAGTVADSMRLNLGHFRTGVPDNRIVKINVPGFVPFWDGVRG